MSLKGLYYKRNVEDSPDLNADVLHCTIHIWMVVVENPDGSTTSLIFNPQMPAVRFRAASKANALYNISYQNEVISTRAILCSVPCELMSAKPRWSTIVDPSLSHLRRCDNCNHLIEHWFESELDVSPLATRWKP